MPLSLRIGLFGVVSVIAGIRFADSLRGLRRGSSRPLHARCDWDRWRHLVIVFSVTFFCVPFLFFMAYPKGATRLSAALDAAAGGDGAETLSRPHDPGPPPPPVGRSRADALRALSTWKEEASSLRRRGYFLLGLLGAVTLGCALALGPARLRRVPAVTAVLLVLGLGAGSGGLLLSGRMARGICGTESARRMLQRLARAPVLPAGEARGAAGLVRLLGRAEPLEPAVASAHQELLPHEPPRVQLNERSSKARDDGYFYYQGPGTEAPLLPEVFRLGEVTVFPARAGGTLVLSPRTRIGRAGKEKFIGSDEKIVAMGFLLEGKLTSAPSLPLAVAPADGGGLRRILEVWASREVLKPPLPLPVLQLLFGASAAWMAALLLASVTEFVLVRAGAGEPAARPSP